jgi:hypothetical protein
LLLAGFGPLTSRPENEKALPMEAPFSFVKSGREVLTPFGCEIELGCSKERRRLINRRAAEYRFNVDII